MSLTSSILLWLHIAAGTISLFLFWIPVLTKKGRTQHLRLGKLYVYAMYIVVGSAFILSVLRFLTGEYAAGLALFFLAILTTIPLVSGVQILSAKKITPTYRRLRLVMASALLLTTVALFAGWRILDSGLLLGFGIIGILGSVGDFKRFIPASGSSTKWLREHYEGMFFSGAAAYTAFFAFGGRTVLGDLLTGWWTLIPWVLPTLLTMALLPLVHRRFKQANAGIHVKRLNV